MGQGIGACYANEPTSVVNDAKALMNNGSGAITTDMAKRGLDRLGDGERTVRHVTNVMDCAAKAMTSTPALAEQFGLNATRIGQAEVTYTRAVKAEYDKQQH
jgi:hypothetical protein